ncbi:uncharacterized protein LOC106639210 [Copidosoma floridanum]|uniref:uncharacterized protein LOC106639210 n=1 Tax=Copidosoma floridanum TaxID=29053 RepID=UPI000C6F6104|nr:uncharacterized protein LOC106639210 [Copidosoma floridanum]
MAGNEEENKLAVKEKTKLDEPFAIIHIQPLIWGLRFRYNAKKNGEAYSVLRGTNSTTECPLYPTIKVFNHFGKQMFVIVSCVTKKGPPYLQHPFQIVGSSCDDKGYYHSIVDIPEDSRATELVLKNIGIKVVRKQDMVKSLEIRERDRVDPFNAGFSHKIDFEKIDVSSVRLAIQVYLQKPDGEFGVALKPIVTEPIYNGRLASKTLDIVFLSPDEGSMKGGELITLLCTKIFYEDIIVKFIHEESGWQGFGKLVEPFHHRKFVLFFETPCYDGPRSEQGKYSFVDVKIQLERRSDGKRSGMVPFKFISHGSDLGVMLKNVAVRSLQVDHEIPNSNKMPRIVKGRPYLEIVRQPCPIVKFPHEKESSKYDSHIFGEAKGHAKKSYMTIKFFNNIYKMFLSVCCVTADYPYNFHPNSIVTKTENHKFIRNGFIHEIPIEANQKELVFNEPLLFSIQHLKKSDYEAKQLEIEGLKVNPFGSVPEFSEAVKSMDVHRVRLGFFGYYEKNDEIMPLDLVVSNVITDARIVKRPCIRSLSRGFGPVNGGVYLILCCDNIDPNDTKVEFYHENEDKEITWKVQANPVYFHEQAAIICRTPSYYDQNTKSVIDVNIQLIKGSCDLRSIPYPFMLWPIPVRVMNHLSSLMSQSASIEYHDEETSSDSEDEEKNEEMDIESSRDVAESVKKQTMKRMRESSTLISIKPLPKRPANVDSGQIKKGYPVPPPFRQLGNTSDAELQKIVNQFSLGTTETPQTLAVKCETDVKLDTSKNLPNSNPNMFCTPQQGVPPESLQVPSTSQQKCNTFDTSSVLENHQNAIYNEFCPLQNNTASNWAQMSSLDANPPVSSVEQPAGTPNECSIPDTVKRLYSKEQEREDQNLKFLGVDLVDFFKNSKPLAPLSPSKLGNNNIVENLSVNNVLSQDTFGASSDGLQREPQRPVEKSSSTKYPASPATTARKQDNDIFSCVTGVDDELFRIIADLQNHDYPTSDVQKSQQYTPHPVNSPMESNYFPCSTNMYQQPTAGHQPMPPNGPHKHPGLMRVKSEPHGYCNDPNIPQLVSAPCAPQCCCNVHNPMQVQVNYTNPGQFCARNQCSRQMSNPHYPVSMSYNGPYQWSGRGVDQPQDNFMNVVAPAVDCQSNGCTMAHRQPCGSNTYYKHGHQNMARTEVDSVNASSPDFWHQYGGHSVPQLQMNNPGCNQTLANQYTSYQPQMIPQQSNSYPLQQRITSTDSDNQYPGPRNQNFAHSEAPLVEATLQKQYPQVIVQHNAPVAGSVNLLTASKTENRLDGFNNERLSD